MLFILCTKFWYQSWTKDWHSDTVWRAPLWVPYFSMPVGLGLLVLQYVADLIGVVTGRTPPFALSPDERRRMSPAAQGSVVLVVTVLTLLSGIPVAFGLGAIAVVFLVLFQGFDSIQVVAETFYSGLDEFTLVAIPMFIMMGAAIGSSPAGKDLYEALDRWLYRVPGGLVISNLGACAIFAALTGSSPATCAAIGKMGIPEMRQRGYPDEVATGSICAGGTLGILIPPSITFILYGIATETSIGRLFLAGVFPGLLLTVLFMAWTLLYIWMKGFRAYAPEFRFSWKQKFESIPKVAPFLAVVIGVMYVLYGGVATPSEAAGVGAAFCAAAGGFHLSHVEPARVVGDPALHHARVGDDPDDHRRRRAVRLHADLALHHPDVGAGDRRRAFQSLGADGDDQLVPAGLRLLHPAGRHHPDDGADPAAHYHGSRLRPGLVRRHRNHQHGRSA